jgi:hypothetical protein
MGYPEVKKMDFMGWEDYFFLTSSFKDVIPAFAGILSPLKGGNTFDLSQNVQDSKISSSGFSPDLHVGLRLKRRIHSSLRLIEIITLLQSLPESERGFSLSRKAVRSRRHNGRDP